MKLLCVTFNYPAQRLYYNTVCNESNSFINLLHINLVHNSSYLVCAHIWKRYDLDTHKYFYYLLGQQRV